MTTSVQRLDPPCGAYAYYQGPMQGPMSHGARGTDFYGLLRGAARMALAIAAASLTATLACAAGVVTQAQAQTTPAAQESPAQPESAPAQIEGNATPPKRGMVRYDRPVFHNGHRVLWHGAWRGGGGKPMSGAEAASAKSGAASGAAAAADKPHDFLILADSADASATRMATEFAGAMQGGGQHIKAIQGKTSAAALDKAISSDSADLAVVSMDSLADKGAAGWRERAPYLARLANEPIALVAPRAITDISQLAGRKVNVEAPDSATAASAAIVFSRLNIAPTTTNEHLPDALARLAHGQIDAVFVVGVDDAKALADFGKDSQFHLVAIPYTPALQAFYCPMRLTSRDQPNLIAGDEKVDTISVPMALVAIDAAPNSPRADSIKPLATAFFEQFDQLLGSSGNADWKGVNLAAQIVGWPRFGASQAWLEQNKGAPNAALDTFRNMAQTAAAASEGPSGADSDRLYESLMQMSGGAR
jgi:TRAP-type uncharacterized transport system substrate-binding protein